MEDSASFLIVSEVDLIKSTYGGEVEDLHNKDVVLSEQPFHTACVRLYLTPSKTFSGKQPDCHIMCIIKVDTDNEYPASRANFTIEDYKGITDQEKDELEALLMKLTKTAAQVRTPVFYSICHNTKNFLLQHSRPEEKSVYDAILARQQKDLQEQRGRKMEEKHELYLLKSSRSVSEALGSGKKMITLSCSGKQEKVVEVGELLAQSEDKHRTTRKVLDQCTRSESVLHTWKVRIEQPERRKLTEHAKVCEAVRLKGLLTKLNSIEREMPSLLKLSSDSVVEYEAYKIIRKSKNITIHLLQPYLLEKTLSHFLKLRVKLNESYLKCIARGCLLSLVYLHQHGIAHGDLKVSNIYMDTNMSPVFRIADYSVERQVCEAVLGYHFMAALLEYPIPSQKDKQKSDVFRLGSILISLTKGRRINKIDLKIPSVFSPEFRDFFKRCLDPNEVTRWSAANLLEHGVFAEHPSRSLDDPLDEGTAEDSKSNQEKKRRESCVPSLDAEGDNPDDAIAMKRTSTSED